MSGDERRLVDARPGELVSEPDGVLRAMAEGAIECTETTRILARQELDARRLRRVDERTGARP